MIRAASPGSDRGGPGRCEGCYRVTDILVIRWKSIGDVVFALPAVNALRARFPEARITFLTSRENVFVPEGFRAVDRVWSIDRDALRGRRVLSGAWATARLLAATRREGFSLVVDLQGYGETAAFSRWSGATQRWGYRTGFIRHRAYTTCMERPASRHPALGHLELLTRSGLGPCGVDNAFEIAPGLDSQARRFLEERGIGPGVAWAYMQPFTSSKAKDWPLDRYLHVASLLRARGCRLMWGGSDRDARAMLSAGVPGHEVLSGVSRAMVAALLKQASMVIGGDTGFIHLAVALGRPVIMVGSRNMVLPLEEHGFAARATTDGVGDVDVEQVVGEVRRRLGEPLGSLGRRSRAELTSGRT